VGGSVTYIDDIVIDDTNWPGLGGLYVLTPDGQGTYSAWTGTHTDSYIETDAETIGTKESFTLSDLPANAVQCERIGAVCQAQLIGAGAGAISPFIDAGSIPAGQALSLGNRFMANYFDGPFTPAAVNALELGVASA